MCQTVARMVQPVPKKALGAPDVRKQWCQCCDELSEMISQEVKTNPRYNKLRSNLNTPEPDR